jgi:hypothetical protein
VLVDLNDPVKRSSDPAKHRVGLSPTLLIIVTKHPTSLGTEPEPVEAERQTSPASAAVDGEPVDALTEEVEALDALLGARLPPADAALPLPSTSPTKAHRRRRPIPPIEARTE